MSEFTHSPPATPIVACLCAAWCDVCRSYRSRFEKVQAQFQDVKFVWVDIEDEFEMMGTVEVDNFPTIMIIADSVPIFFGTITPQTETLMRLVKSHVAENNAAPLMDENLRRLALEVEKMK